MSTLATSRADSQVRSITIWVVLAGGLLVLYLVGRATGAITVVGYQSGRQTQWGLMGQSTGIDLSWSTWLNPGEALRADYEVKASYGSLRLAAHPTTHPWHGYQTAWAHISGERTGSVLFVAQEGHYFRFKPEATAGYGRVCRSPSVASAILPPRNCPTYDVGYSVTWRRVPAEQVTSSTAAEGIRVLMPRRNEPLATIAINDCGGQMVCGI